MPHHHRAQAAHLRRRRNHLYTRDPHCFWCGCLTILPPRPAPPNWRGPDNEASIDHLYERNHPWRHKTTKTYQRYVLACRSCNSKRANLEIPPEKRWVFEEWNSNPLLKRIYITLVASEAEHCVADRQAA